jgi:hypothetical protein
MEQSRNVSDYLILVAVRQRRGKELKRRLQLALDEHQQCIRREPELRLSKENLEKISGDYADRVHELTFAGRRINVDDLQSSRAHSELLKAECQMSYEAWINGVRTSHEASISCVNLTQLMRINELRIDSLKDLSAESERMQISASEELEDEESSESISHRK